MDGNSVVFKLEVPNFECLFEFG